MDKNLTPIQKASIVLIKTYQVIISPLLGPRCRFTPSCSDYAVTAISRFGLIKGGWLGSKRLLKCHPLHPGGHDPVPKPQKKD